MANINSVEIGLQYNAYNSGASTTKKRLLDETLTGISVLAERATSGTLPASSTAISFFPSGYTASNSLKFILFAKYNDAEAASERVLTLVNGTATMKIGEFCGGVVQGTTFTIESSIPVNAVEVEVFFYIAS